MVTDDVSEGDGMPPPQIQNLENLGFDVDAIDIELDALSASELEQIQAKVSLALLLRKRIQPFLSSTEIQEMNQDLANPFNVETVESRFLQWAATNAPWAPGYFRWYQVWSENEDVLSQYWDIIERCAKLDESSWTSLDLLLPLLSESANYPRILSELALLVDDEGRQRTLLEKAVHQLQAKGYTIEFSSLKIIDQFDKVEEMQTYSNQIDLLELDIQSSILPYDPILADTFMKRVAEFIETPSVEISTLQKNVETVSEHLETRLEEMNALIHKWYTEGFSYHERLRILPEELLEWEHLLPEIEQQYHRHAGAYERWKEISKLWDYADASIDQLAGRLEHTDAFLDKIESLEQQWTEKELQGASLIERWEQLGFDMDIWRYKITQDPRQGLLELNQKLPAYQRANDLLENMLRIDTSLGGEEDVEQRASILRTMDLEVDLLDEMQQWLEKKTLRNTRHRRLLQSEWEQAVREGKAKSGATFSDLHSFEIALASIEHQSRGKISNNTISNAISRTNAELLRLESRGWNITELLHLQEKEPGSFFNQFGQSMEAVSRIGPIQRRIGALDWRRDVGRADAVSNQIRNPLELVRIEQQIPALIRHLAERDIEDEDYTYSAWLPEQRPVLLPREQSVIQKIPAKVQPNSTLEEAHEAMLEAMDEHSEPTTVGDDDVNVVETTEIIHPSTKTPKETTLEEIKSAAPVKPKEQAKPLKIPTREIDVSSYEHLLHVLGLTTEANALAGSGDVSNLRRALASHVGVEPRDIRVDRLLRLVLRLLPQNDSNDSNRSKMIDSIGDALPKYTQWVRMRLEARHMGASGDFFEDAARLGMALNRTPGPGVRVPLQADLEPLPESTNMEELHHHTERLIQSMALPAAGGIN
tara:strand:- start:238 stop:2868 length:2631 start_codon:yes stop_codon:yes gene_type:complete